MFIQHYITYLPEISKTSAIMQMSERLGIFMSEPLSRVLVVSIKKVCVYSRHSYFPLQFNEINQWGGLVVPQITHSVTLSQY